MFKNKTISTIFNMAVAPVKAVAYFGKEGVVASAKRDFKKARKNFGKAGASALQVGGVALLAYFNMPLLAVAAYATSGYFSEGAIQKHKATRNLSHSF